MDQIFVDEETGESICLPVSNYEIRHFPTSTNNVETGEPETDLVGVETSKCRRIRFQVMCSNNCQKISVEYVNHKIQYETYYVNNERKLQGLEIEFFNTAESVLMGMQFK